MLKNSASYADLRLKESDITNDYEYNIEYQLNKVSALFYDVRYNFLNRVFDTDDN